MGWLITGLLALLVVLAVLTRRGRRRPAADDALVAELLGPPARRALPAPAVREEAEPPSTPAAGPAGEDDWLETQLAWITAWSERMHAHIASTAADSEPVVKGQAQSRPARHLLQAEREPRAGAVPADDSSLTDHGPCKPPHSRTAPRRCTATTAKGSQCKLPAEPGDTACAIHAGRAHP